ncbi:zeta toxin family protein [Embleya sp. NPDC005971]|uniref:zeta toxin family protein n=1 Tax=Embleya sp. NPDC005971 TaxID=3156724 RepID=UPI0033ED0A99
MSTPAAAEPAPAPTPYTYRLDGDEHRRIFREEILPDLLDGAGPPRERPTVLFIAGQPGAGKSTIEPMMMDEIGMPRDAVRIDGDDLAAYHPRHRDFVAENDRTAASRVSPDTGPWWIDAVSRVCEERRDLVISAPLGQAEWSSEQVLTFLGEGYNVEIAFVATHPALSLAGNLDRYHTARQPDSQTPARLVPVEVHDRVVPSVLDTAEHMQNERIVDALHVARRDVGIVHSTRLVGNEWTDPTPVREVIVDERSREWSPETVDRFRAQVAHLQGVPAEDVPLPDDLAPHVERVIERGEEHILDPTVRYTADLIVPGMPEAPQVLEPFTPVTSPATPNHGDDFEIDM